MDAVTLAVTSAALFGAMPVAVRFALVPPLVPAAVGALLMQTATFVVLCIAAAFQVEAFEWLDAPVRIVGALDSAVPYSPPLEEFFLPNEAQVERSARLLTAY